MRRSGQRLGINVRVYLILDTEATPCIPVAYSMSESLDTFNLVLIVLMPCLTGFLFDLYPKFSAGLTSLVTTFFHLLHCFSALQLFIVHLFTIVYE